MILCMTLSLDVLVNNPWQLMANGESILNYLMLLFNSISQKAVSGSTVRLMSILIAVETLSARQTSNMVILSSRLYSSVTNPTNTPKTDHIGEHDEHFVSVLW